VLVLLAGAHPEGIETLVRALVPEHPRLEVHTDARRLATVEPGTVVLLVPDPSQATWLNLERPLFAQRALRTILFADEPMITALVRQAPDFYNWISHRIELPEAPSRHARRTVQAALCARAAGIVWTGGNLRAVFQAALPGRSLMFVSAAISYEEMVYAARPAAHRWIAWTDVGDAMKLHRVKWAMAEAGRRGRALLVEPLVGEPSYWVAHERSMPLPEAISSLEAAGAARGGRLAALTGFGPGAIQVCGALLRKGMSATVLERALLDGDVDPEAVLATLAIEQGGTLPEGALRLRGAGDRANAQDLAEIELQSRGEERRWATAAWGANNAGEPRIALSWARRALHADENDASALAAAGHALKELGSTHEAEEMLRRSIDVMKHHPTSASADDITTRSSLAQVLKQQGEYAEAEAVLREAITLAEQPPPPPIDVEELKVSGIDVSKIEEVLLRLEDLSRNLRRMQLAVLLQSLSDLVEAQGGHDEAERLLRTSILLEPKNAAAHHGLGGLLFRLGRYEEAEVEIVEALRMLEQSVGLEHPSYAKSLHELANIRAVEGRYAEAELLFRTCLLTWNKQPGENLVSHAATLNGLAGVMHAQGSAFEAERLLRQALALAEEHLAPNDPILSVVLAQLGSLLGTLGRAAEGDPYVQRAVAIARGGHPESRHELGEVLAALAQVQAAQDKPEAAATAKEALGELMRSLGPQHPVTMRLKDMLTDIAGSNPEAQDAAEPSSPAPGSSTPARSSTPSAQSSSPRQS
jgi:tetratricopeptide (TPR) repeat protein